MISCFTVGTMMSDMDMVGANRVAYRYPVSLMSSSIFTVTLGPYCRSTSEMSLDSSLSLMTLLTKG